MIQVLIVDDEKELVEAVKKKLSKEGIGVSVAFTAKEAISLIKERSFDVGVLDIKLPDMDGVDLLEKLKEIQPTLEVIMLTGFASVDTAIRSMKLGAYDYLTKPCKLSRLHSLIIRAYERKSLAEKNVLLEEQLSRVMAYDEFIGDSEPMREVKRLISIVAPSDMPVLILGETGTGKELVARSIHNQSPRAKNNFVPVNSSILQESIAESELFGHRKGAFTGAQKDKMGLLELANGGTFFMDEVGDMSPAIQAKLLRVLETGRFRKLGDVREISVDVRVVCATNRDLEEEVEAGRFRKDLFFRLNSFVIKLPPLRERKEDIPQLVEYFLKKFSGGRKRISKEAMDLLVSYRWPGNVRELKNVVEKAVLLSSSKDEISVEDLPPNLMDVGSDVGGNDYSTPSDMLKLEEVEKRHIERVLKIAGGNKSKAARLLGISRRKLYHKLVRFGLV